MLGSRHRFSSVAFVCCAASCSEPPPADARCYTDARLDSAFASAKAPVEVEQARARLAIAMSSQEAQHLREFCWEVTANEALSDPTVRKALDVVSPYAASTCETEESRFRGAVNPQTCLSSPNCAAWIDFILNRLGQRVRFNNDGTIDSCERAQEPDLCVAYILSVLKSEMDSTVLGGQGEDDGLVTATGSASEGPGSMTNAASADDASDGGGGGSCDPADVFELSGLGGASGVTETIRVSTVIPNAFFGVYSCEPNCDVVFDAVFTLNADGTGSWNNSMVSNRSFRWGVAVDETCNLLVTEGTDEEGPYQALDFYYVYTGGDEEGVMYGGILGYNSTSAGFPPYFSKGCGSDCYDP